MEIYTTSQARANLYKLVDLAALSREPVYIIGRRNKVVLLSEEEFSSMQETISLLSIPGMKESILEADKEPIENCKSEIDWD